MASSLRWSRVLALAGLACLSVPDVARADAAAHAADGFGKELYPEIVQSSVFLHYHPDLRHRRDGFLALERGAFDLALRYFTRAAYFGDKAAQAMVAQMYRDGTGVVQDRSLAYAWMDLAAERGYPVFVAYRERFWGDLSAAERERAVEVGGTVYSEYGDKVAKPRMEHMLRKGRMDFTGSRVGYVPFGLEVKVVSPTGGWMTIPDDKAYEKRFWHASDYFEWQDAVFRRPVRGAVEVGPIEQASQPSR